MRDRRFGEFKVAEDTIQQFPFAVRLLMGKIIVLHAYFSMVDQCVNYIAQSPLFPEVKEGMTAPRYKIEMNAGEWELKEVGQIEYCQPSLTNLRDWNPVIDPVNAEICNIFLPEKNAQIAIGLTNYQARSFCRHMAIALAAGESLDESAVTAGNAMRAEATSQP